METILNKKGQLKNPVEKICPICLKIFIDYSKSHAKKTCTHQCRRKLQLIDIPDGEFQENLRYRMDKLTKKNGVIVTDEDYKNIVVGLNIGVCEVCGEKPKFRQLHIDHNHETKKYRGILCSNCNHSLHVGITPKILRKLADYLEKNTA